MLLFTTFLLAVHAPFVLVYSIKVCGLFFLKGPYKTRKCFTAFYYVSNFPVSSIFEAHTLYLEWLYKHIRYKRDKQNKFTVSIFTRKFVSTVCL